jgi:AbrB family looped-hinge helix DNA binding protein
MMFLGWSKTKDHIAPPAMMEASDLRSCQVIKPLAPWLFVPSMLTLASSEEDRLLPKEQADYTYPCVTAIFLSRIKYCHRNLMSVESFRKESLRKDIMPAIAKITSKGQTTIPVEVRESLNFNPGDLLEWEVNADGSAKVRRIQPLDLEYMRAVEGTLTEWGCAEDEEAYRGL